MARKLFLVLFVILLTGCSNLPLPISRAATDVPKLAVEVDASPVVCPTCEAPTCPATATVPANPPTATFTPVQPSPTFTSTPIPAPSLTFTPIVPTNTPLPIVQQFALQQGSPVYVQNFAHPTQGCSWAGIAGQVFNRQGTPIKNLVVVVEGFVENNPVDLLQLTGLAPSYGAGGYEVVLNNKAFESNNALFISLYDLAGTRLTVPVAVNTRADCGKNLILINFVELPPL